MGKYYCVRDWDAHYEVDKDGRAWTAGKAFRQGPLEYLRVPARRDWNVKMMELEDRVGENVWLYVGIFEKLCGIVGCESRPRRAGGVIRNSKGEPASLDDIAKMLRVSHSTMVDVLATLCSGDIEWLQEIDDAQGAQDDGHSGMYRLPREEWDRISRHAEVEEGPPVSQHPPVIRQERRDSASSPQAASVATVGENRLQYKSSQVRANQEQVKSREPSDTVVSLSAAAAPLLSRGTPDVSVRSALDSTRLDFLFAMRRTLGADERRDARTVTNFEQWVHENIASGRAGPELRRQSLNIARDCVHGDRPVAVFLTRVRDELGYIAPSRRPACGQYSTPRFAAER
jgi:hypothetical protein